MTRARLSLLTSLLVLALPGCSSTPDTMVLGLAYHPTSQVDLNRLQGAPPISAATRVWINPIADVHPEARRLTDSIRDMWDLDNRAVGGRPAASACA